MILPACAVFRGAGSLEGCKGGTWRHEQFLAWGTAEGVEGGEGCIKGGYWLFHSMPEGLIDAQIPVWN